jgi:hypothetical protein
MSQENVENAKQATDALNRRDWDAFYGLITPDFEWLPVMPGPSEVLAIEADRSLLITSPRSRRRGSTCARSWRTYATSAIACCCSATSRGLEGQAVCPSRCPWRLMDFRDGKLARDCVFLDHNEALKAVGLAE